MEIDSSGIVAFKKSSFMREGRKVLSRLVTLLAHWIAGIKKARAFAQAFQYGE